MPPVFYGNLPDVFGQAADAEHEPRALGRAARVLEKNRRVDAADGPDESGVDFRIELFAFAGERELEPEILRRHVAWREVDDRRQNVRRLRNEEHREHERMTVAATGEVAVGERELRIVVIRKRSGDEHVQRDDFRERSGNAHSHVFRIRTLDYLGQKRDCGRGERIREKGGVLVRDDGERHGPKSTGLPGYMSRETPGR